MVKVFVGVIGSGKDYNSEIFLRENEASKRVGFSDSLREHCWKFLGWEPRNQEEYEAFKVSEVQLPGQSFKTTGRDLLLNIGTFMRTIDRDYWAKRGAHRIDLANSLGNKNIVISDCRFYNEVKHAALMAADLGLEIQFTYCNYKSEKYTLLDHESEFMAQNYLELKDGTDITKRILNDCFDREGWEPNRCVFCNKLVKKGMHAHTLKGPAHMSCYSVGQV